MNGVVAADLVENDDLSCSSAGLLRGSADCNGVHVAAPADDADQANRWSVTIGGVTGSGTFGSSFNQTFPVPQAGATTAWSAFVEAQDGSYHGARSGTVGPCGTPVDDCADLPGNQPTATPCLPPPDVTRADSQALEGCDVAFGGTTYGAGDLTTVTGEVCMEGGPTAASVPPTRFRSLSPGPTTASTATFAGAMRFQSILLVRVSRDRTPGAAVRVVTRSS